ncbi:MAG: acyl carrier protein [Acetobacteraceae bacterium]|nr:acyl carrier protein [Acetobacteraceae bacterium]
MTRDDILAYLAGCLHETFEIPAENISPEARLYEDLDLDSIDAVDLMVKLNELTGRKISPEQFKSVRTVADVLDHVQDLMDA